ncbi:MAG: asparagine synthase (glutamine-hydrolyzing) [Candidatus Methanoperedens sp.]|nr:asparagine synthase (glutamine-hydrolyzing) [Candidatus Methanoperedens sp.]
MCGITGYYSIEKYESNLKKIVEMTDLIRHRGPDDEGYVFIDTHSNVFIDASGPDSPEAIKADLKEVESLDEVRHNLAFGHRRYAIIDLTPGGHQPFWDKNRSVCISFNGEIYNYIELKEELEQKGHKFLTLSDTEVLVEAYLEWGENCFCRLNGPYALSLYDVKKHKLLFSRDRIGKSPLYYTIRNNVLYWSSEIKSLLHVCEINAFSINKQAIYDFINYGLRDLENSTFWEEIHTFPAATYAWVDDSLNLQHYTYWTIPEKRLSPSEISFEEAKKQFRNLLLDALNIRSRSDISVGFTLSGGLDSSSLIALYTIVLKKYTVSFTVKFPQREANEEAFARMVAERCGKFVDYRVVEPSFDCFWEDANDYVWLMDEPFHSPNLHTDLLLQKELKSQGQGVVIYGAGGDELLAGYEAKFYPLYLDYLIHSRKLLLFIRECFSWKDKDLKAFNRVIWPIMFNINPVIKNFIKKILLIKNESKQNSLFLRGIDKVKKRSIPDDFNGRMIGDMGQWLMNYWLRSDNTSYFSVPIEARAPFLDYRLIDFAFRLPAEYLIRNGWHKYILRKAVEDILPGNVVWRKNKMGFPFPHCEWLESSRFIVEKNLKDINCPYVDVGQLFEKYSYMTKYDPVLLWRYISVLLWWKRVILKEPIVSEL